MIRRALSLCTLVFALASCEFLAPPSSTDFGKACGPDVDCAGDLACIDGYCQPGGDDDDDDAGVSDGG